MSIATLPKGDPDTGAYGVAVRAVSDSTAGVPLTSRQIVRRGIVAEARACLGTRFRHQGRQPGVGLDCVGLVAVVGHRLGLVDYDLTAYGRLPRPGELERHIAAAGFTPLAPAEAVAGDVLLMRIERLPQHVAIRSDRGIIHAWAATRRVVEHGLDHGWRQRIVGAYRFPGL